MIVNDFLRIRLWGRLAMILFTASLGIALEASAFLLDPMRENLALQKPTVASSEESIVLKAENVNDGDPNTRWSSQFADNQWIIIDLEASYDVQQVVLNWETAYGKSYDLDVSVDGFNWETVFEERSGDGGIDVINLGVPAPARFVRMLGLLRGTSFGFSLWEFEIYESDPVQRYVAGNGVDDANDCLDSANPCATITHAIDQANPGNTIQIAAGTYTESFIIDKSLSLRGDGQGSTIIQASAVPGVAGERVITIAAGLVVEITAVTIRHGQVTGGGAAGEGGGIFSSDSTLALSNVTLAANEARSGGGLYNKNGGFIDLNSVTFSGNRATAVGGGMRNFSSSSSRLVDVVFIGNEADRGGGMANNTGFHELVGVTFTENVARLGGGLYNVNSSPELIDVIFDSNNADDNGGGLYNNGSSPALVNTTFTENKAGNGGGVYNFSNSFPMFSSVVFIDNEAIGGGGMFNFENSSPLLTNVTFSKNRASVVGGAVLNINKSTPTLVNTILWGNVAAAMNGGNEIYNEDDSAVALFYSLYQDKPGDIVEGGGFDVDEHSLTDDPLFVDAENGDLHLQEGSPAINAGDPDTLSSLFATDDEGNPVDLDGKPRFQEGRIDIGAFEYDATLYQLFMSILIK
jgi:hypothetical protein